MSRKIYACVKTYEKYAVELYSALRAVVSHSADCNKISSSDDTEDILVRRNALETELFHAAVLLYRIQVATDTEEEAEEAAE